MYICIHAFVFVIFVHKILYSRIGLLTICHRIVHVVCILYYILVSTYVTDNNKYVEGKSTCISFVNGQKRFKKVYLRINMLTRVK